MVRYLTPLLAAALCLGTLPALAQDSTDSTASETPSQTADSGLDLGQPVNDAPQNGERYLKETIGDWSLACIKTDLETDPCSIMQILNDKSGNSVAEISLFRLEGAGQAVAAATVIVPLETLLPAQLTIAVDGNKGKRYNYNFCNPVGCYAQIGLTADDIAAFKKGSVAKISLVPAPAPDQVVELEMSLAGFTAGYDLVDVVSNN
ncbi:invasion associated locus B family protein [Chachezhania sediminis]|uniref:invasion associated locus B family protein n=1 Tax=Chachezhania sediminis TaxID=2599291 RepID=UPI00131CAF8A|nr:invasion associated locus B family protein [Chachezhania sediminis]